MIGRDFHQAFPPKRQHLALQDGAARLEGTARQDGAASALEVRNLNIHGILKDISFTLGKGEILGFAGLVGSGRTETAEAVMGLRRIDGGTILVDGEVVRIDSPRDAVRHGLGYLSEDRQGRGIVQSFSIPRNITLISLKRYVSRFLVDFSKEAKKSAEYIKLFNIVAASQSMALRYLSGGNQQKVYLARWVDTNPRILILDEPTRGIDVNAKREIYDFIHRLADQGISCIVISSEMEEVIGLCDRVYVMRGGSISGCLSGERVTEEEIMFYAAGIKGKVD
jgi:ribose transport system ATP-binding protein